jgi:hypothetical protein
LNTSIGSLQNQKELRPENFENAMTMGEISITQMSDATKKQTRQEKIRNSINTKENSNKALYSDIEKKLKERSFIGQKSEINMGNPAESLVGVTSPTTELAGTNHKEKASAAFEYSG